MRTKGGRLTKICLVLLFLWISANNFTLTNECPFLNTPSKHGTSNFPVYDRREIEMTDRKRCLSDTMPDGRRKVIFSPATIINIADSFIYLFSPHPPLPTQTGPQRNSVICVSFHHLRCVGKLFFFSLLSS